MKIDDLTMTIGEYTLDILWQGDDSKPVLVSITHEAIGNILDQEYPNAVSASADIRDTLGLGPAIDLLTAMGIDTNSALWDLNHSNPHRRT